MAEVIRKTSEVLQQAMAHLRRAELKAVLPLTVEINRLENQGDHLVPRRHARPLPERTRCA